MLAMASGWLPVYSGYNNGFSAVYQCSGVGDVQLQLVSLKNLVSL